MPLAKRRFPHTMDGDRAALAHPLLSSLAVASTVRHDHAMLACLPMSLLAGVAL